ncbi:MAG TPA: hypothetical protein VM571_13060, partial [Noviherbaspirillum sp.]|nr:hypothetical protein [Noviherbaspirillum sp.]
MQVTSPNLSEPEVSFNQPYAEAIEKRQDTINTLERLCIQVSGTLRCLAKPNGDGFHTFVREHMVWVDENNASHSTTTAQCISALQDLVRIMGSLKLHTPESSNLLFQTLPAHSVAKP